MKRFTATEKWDDPWFRKLKPVAKLFWEYVRDKCDNAGVIDLDEEAASFHIGMKVVWKELQPSFEGRIVRLPNKKLLIVGFLEFQYGKLSQACKPHQRVIELLIKHGLWDVTLNTLSLPYNGTLLDRVSNTLQEEEEEKDKEEDKDKGESEGKTSPDPKPLSPTKQLSDSWCSEFQKYFGAPYKFTPRDGVGASELLKVNGHTPEEFVAIARKAWENSKGFWSKHAVTLWGFSHRFNEIRGELGLLVGKGQDRRPSIDEVDARQGVLR